MSIRKQLCVAAIAVGVSMGLTVTASADTPVVANSGWQIDEIDTAGDPSPGSLLTFTVDPGFTWSFALTDAYVVGDTYTMTLNGVDVFTTTPGLTATPFVNNLGPFAVPFAAAWDNPDYSKLLIESSAGTFDISVTGDGVGGLPAHFGYRLDTYAITAPSGTPEPAAWAMMILGLGAVGAAMRRPRRSGRALA